MFETKLQEPKAEKFVELPPNAQLGNARLLSATKRLCESVGILLNEITVAAKTNAALTLPPPKKQDPAEAHVIGSLSRRPMDYTYEGTSETLELLTNLLAKPGYEPTEQLWVAARSFMKNLLFSKYNETFQNRAHALLDIVPMTEKSRRELFIEWYIERAAVGLPRVTDQRWRDALLGGGYLTPEEIGKANFEGVVALLTRAPSLEASREDVRTALNLYPVPPDRLADPRLQKAAFDCVARHRTYYGGVDVETIEAINIFVPPTTAEAVIPPRPKPASSLPN